MIRAFLGGSFDPVHSGHVAMARYLLQAQLADVVHVVPAWLSPHKENTRVGVEHRLAMARLAFATIDDLIIEDVEVESGRACFTVETLSTLQKAYENASWLLVIGGDNLATFGQWHQPAQLQALAKIVVLGRGNCDLSDQAIPSAGLAPERVVCYPDFDLPVSSTEVRALLQGGLPSAPVLAASGIPAAVAEYIIAHQLYAPNQNGENCVPDPD